MTQQLVGTRCLRCQQQIWSNNEGRFCPECGTPHHHRCAGPDLTPETAARCSACQCNTENPFAVEFREEPLRRAEAARQGLAGRIAVVVVLLQLVVLINIAWDVWITWQLMRLDPVTRGILAAIPFVVPIVGQVAVVGLCYRRPWAWTATVVVFLLSLPSVLAVFGIFLVFNPEVRGEFGGRQGEEKTPVG
jgi:hypothetical protein